MPRFMKKILRKAILPLMLASTISVKAQEANVVFTNSLINGTIGLIGSAVNEKNIYEGFAQGFLGGTLVGLGKYWVGENANGAWGAKIVSSIGNSITYNTARGDNSLDMIMMDIGPVLLTYHKNKGFKPYILAKSTYDLIITISEGYEFDFNESLKRGTPIFNGGRMYGLHGLARSNILIIEEHDPRLTQILRHELVHSYQYSQSFALESLLRNIPVMEEINNFSDKYYLKFDYSHYFLMEFQANLWEYDSRPLEIEANILAKKSKF